MCPLYRIIPRARRATHSDPECALDCSSQEESTLWSSRVAGRVWCSNEIQQRIAQLASTESLFKQSKLYDTPEQHARLRLRPFVNESCSYPVKLSAELTNGSGTMPGHPIGFECAFFIFHKPSGHSGTRCMAFTRALG